MREKDSNRLVQCPNYIVDALNLPNQAPEVSDNSPQTCVALSCPSGIEDVFCWPIAAASGQIGR